MMRRPHGERPRTDRQDEKHELNRDMRFDCEFVPAGINNTAYAGRIAMERCQICGRFRPAAAERREGR